MDVKSKRDVMPDSLIAIKVYQLAAIQQQISDQKKLYDLMAGQLNKLKQMKAKIEDELKDEQQFQFDEHGVASIHPALSLRKRVDRDFSETTINDIPESEWSKYLVINESENSKIMSVLMDLDDSEKLLSVNLKALNKLAKDSIQSWSKHSETEVKSPSIKGKLGEYIYNPLSQE